MSSEPTPEIKPGWKTSEFWQTLVLQGLSLAVILKVISPADSAGLGSALGHAIEAIVALIVAGGTVINYVTGRNKLKGG
jgi:hypothetical protein